MLWLKVEPLFHPLRCDPRFQALLRRMNFPRWVGVGQPWAAGRPAHPRWH